MKRTFAALALALATALPAGAVELGLGDDGLHKSDWMHDTFKDLREDLAEANAEGKRLMVTIEQRGCIYCTEMHEKVYPVPEIDAMLNDDYFVIQINMFGDVEITDFDGEVLTEKEAMRKWRVMFTPTNMFFPTEVPEGVDAAQAAVVTMPGAYGKATFKNLLTWVLEKGYLGEENFQKYHARKFNAEQQSE